MHGPLQQKERNGPQSSGPIIIFHQPGFSRRGFPLLFTTIWGDQPAEIGRYNLPR